jgi:hypothetical protein
MFQQGIFQPLEIATKTNITTDDISRSPVVILKNAISEANLSPNAHHYEACIKRDHMKWHKGANSHLIAALNLNQMPSQPITVANSPSRKAPYLTPARKGRFSRFYVVISAAVRSGPLWSGLVRLKLPRCHLIRSFTGVDGGESRARRIGRGMHSGPR